MEKLWKIFCIISDDFVVDDHGQGNLDPDDCFFDQGGDQGDDQGGDQGDPDRPWWSRSIFGPCCQIRKYVYELTF